MRIILKINLIIIEVFNKIIKMKLLTGIILTNIIEIIITIPKTTIIILKNQGIILHFSKMINLIEINSFTMEEMHKITNNKEGKVKIKLNVIKTIKTIKIILIILNLIVETVIIFQIINKVSLKT